MIGRAAALSFGVFKATDLVKEVFLRATGMTLQPYLKSALAMSLSGAVAVAYEQGWKDRLLLAASVAGGSAVVHEGHQVLSTRADFNKINVIARTPMATARANMPGSRRGAPPL